MTGTANRIHLQTQKFGLLLLGQLARSAFVWCGLGIVGLDLGDRLLRRFGRGEDLRVDVQRARGVTEFVDANRLRSKACLIRAAVSVRLATVIITGGVAL